MTYYKQCTLKSGNTETVAWIEERGAVEGYRVTLEDTEDPAQLWTVMQVGSTRRSQTEVQENERLNRKFKNEGSISSK